MRYWQHGYRVLLEQLEQLAAFLGQQDANVGALILFGSTARLTPSFASDVDVLFLCTSPRAFIAPEQAGMGMALFADLTRADQEWAFIPVVSDLNGSDVPEALLANIAHDGVLVYQQPGVPLPAPLMQLQSYARWRAQVQQRLHQEQEHVRPEARQPRT